MERVLSVRGERISEADSRHNSLEVHATSEDTPPTKRLSRSKSLFSLAGNIFKSHMVLNEQDHQLQQQAPLPTKGSWNPFTSLRGSREKRSGPGKFASTRCKSSSPKKNDPITSDEFGRQKTMKRKSLQDLLGTVGGTFSRARRRELEEEILPTCESLSNEQKETPDIPPLILPEPVLPIPPGHDIIMRSLHIFEDEHPTFQSLSNNIPFDSRLSQRRSTPTLPSQRAKSLCETITDRVDGENTSQQINCTIACIGSRDIEQTTGHSAEASSSPKLHRPENSGEDPASLSPSKQRHTLLAENLQDRVLEMPISKTFSGPEAQTEYTYIEKVESTLDSSKNMNLDPLSSTPSSKPCHTGSVEALPDNIADKPRHITFSGLEAQTEYRYNEKFENIPTSSEMVDIGPPVAGRALSRKEKYDAISREPKFGSAALSSHEIARHIILTAAKMSENFHLSTNQRNCSFDSIETDKDDVSQYSWDTEKTEFWDVISRGREIMKEGLTTPHLYSKPLPLDACHPPWAGCTKSVLDQTVGEIEAATSSEVMDILPIKVNMANSVDAVTSANQYLRPDIITTTADRNVAKRLSSIDTTPEPSFGSYTFGAKDEPQNSNHAGSFISKYGSKDEKKVLVSLKIGERFRPVRDISQGVSASTIRVAHPQNGFQTTFTTDCKSMGDAISDPYHSYAGYSENCPLDRASGTLFPQIRQEDLDMERSHPHDNSLEFLCLPTQYGGVSTTMADQPNGPDVNLHAFTDYVFNLGGNGSSGHPSISASDRDFLQALDLSDQDLAASKIQSQVTWHSCHNFEPHVSVVEDSDPPSAAAGYPSLGDRIEPLVTVKEVSASGSGSSASNDALHESEDMDSAFDMAVDSTIARLYQGSCYSSTDSVGLAQLPKLNRPASANSMCYELEDAQQEEARPVKTWADLEKDFLDTYAPINEASRVERAQMAVHKALKRRCVSAAPSDDEEETNFEPYEIKDKGWSRDRSSSYGICFEHIEDIATYESAREQFTEAANKTHVPVDRSLNFVSDSDVPLGTIGKGKGKLEMAQDFVSPWPESELVQAQLSQSSIGSNYKAADIVERTSELAVSSADYAGMECQALEPSSFAKGRRTRYGEIYDADRVDTAMAAEHEFIGIAHKTDQATKKIDKEAKECNSTHKFNGDKGVTIASVDSSFGISISTGLSLKDSNGSAFRVFNKTAQSNSGKSHHLPERLMTQDLTDQNRLGGSTQSVLKNVKLRTSSRNYAEALTASSSRIPRHSISPGRAGISAYTSSTSPASGRKRILTPDRRAITPLAELSRLRNSSVTKQAPPVSEAGTEVSEDFGQALQRCKPTENHSKENDDCSRRDFVLYD